MKIAVTIDWRTAAAAMSPKIDVNEMPAFTGWPGGQLYLLDLNTHTVLDHHVGKLYPESIMKKGGWSGFRGAAWDGEYLYVADMNSIRRFDINNDSFEMIDGWHAGEHYDIHGICASTNKRIWISSTGFDTIARLSFPKWPFAKSSDEWSAYGSLFFKDTRARGHFGDRYHINSVSEYKDELWALSHSGIVIKIKPDHKIYNILQAKGGHSLTIINDDLMVFLDTPNEHFVLCRKNGIVIRTIDCGAQVVEERICPNTGKKAKGGWLRGIAILDDRHAVCGTSPAQLFVVDYRSGKVVDHWKLTDDVRASTFEIVKVD